MKNDKCPRCGTKANPRGTHSTIYQCLSSDVGMGVGFLQSTHCRERCKVAKLKKHVKRLKDMKARAEKAEAELAKRDRALGQAIDALPQMWQAVTLPGAPSSELMDWLKVNRPDRVFNPYATEK